MSYKTIAHDLSSREVAVYVVTCVFAVNLIYLTQSGRPVVMGIVAFLFFPLQIIYFSSITFGAQLSSLFGFHLGPFASFPCSLCIL